MKFAEGDSSRHDRDVLTVVSWNMNQRETAWDHLEEVASRNDVSVALLQEARRPERTLPAGWNVHPPADEIDRWRIAVPRHYRTADGSLRNTKRRFASAVVGRDDQSLTPREPVELHQAVEGTLAASHPGQFAVADVALDGGRSLTVVSLYGIWDRMLDSGDMYAEATLHRAISDLTMIFQERGNDHVLVAGDLNIYSYADGTVWGDRYLTVFSRLAAYGLEGVGPFRPDGEPRLDRCPCPDAECRHVNTFLYRSDRASRPHQLEYVFATPALRDRLIRCWADPDLGWPTYSDHRPVFASFDL